MTKIEWTDKTWNPAVGCSRVSPGCDHCYAARVAGRGLTDAHRGLAEGGQWTDEVRLFPERLDDPLRWRKPSRVFVGSMTDLFHPSVPDAFIVRVLDTIYRSQQHTFQVLTKRPQRMAEFIDRWVRTRSALPPNLWLGVSAENYMYARIRTTDLLWTPAAVRFVSVEPMLGPIDLRPWLDNLGWVIIGGETGPGARKMEVEWAEDLVGQCRDAGVAVFVKQLGSAHGRGHKDFDRFPRSLQVREFPA